MSTRHPTVAPWTDEQWVRSKFEMMGYSGKLFERSRNIKDIDRRIVDVTTPASDMQLQYGRDLLLQNQATVARGGSIDVLGAIFAEHPSDAYLNPERLGLKLPPGVVRTENMGRYEHELSTVQPKDVTKINTREK